jgi:hypothetical protein
MYVCGPHTQQARELISVLSPGAKTRLLSVNRTQFRVVIGFLTGNDNLRRHLHFMELTNIHLCRRCGVKDETSARILCECEALISLRHAYLGSFFLVPEDIKRLSLGPSGTLAKEQGSPELISDYGA